MFSFFPQSYIKILYKIKLQRKSNNDLHNVPSWYKMLLEKVLYLRIGAGFLVDKLFTEKKVIIIIIITHIIVKPIKPISLKFTERKRKYKIV